MNKKEYIESNSIGLGLTTFNIINWNKEEKIKEERFTKAEMMQTHPTLYDMEEWNEMAREDEKFTKEEIEKKTKEDEIRRRVTNDYFLTELEETIDGPSVRGIGYLAEYERNLKNDLKQIVTDDLGEWDGGRGCKIFHFSIGNLEIECNMMKGDARHGEEDEDEQKEVEDEYAERMREELRKVLKLYEKNTISY